MNSMRATSRAKARTHRKTNYAVCRYLREIILGVSLAAGIVLLFGCFGAAQPPAVGSIGAVLSRDTETGRVYVRDVARASDDGVLPGDEIVMIDGVFASNLTSEQLRQALRGPPGSKVSLTIMRSGRALRFQVSRTPLRQSVLSPKTETIQE